MVNFSFPCIFASDITLPVHSVFLVGKHGISNKVRSSESESTSTSMSMWQTPENSSGIANITDAAMTEQMSLHSLDRENSKTRDSRLRKIEEEQKRRQEHLLRECGKLGRRQRDIVLLAAVRQLNRRR